jgi:hypothetical protein
VDDLVRGAADDKPGQVAAATRAHHDDSAVKLDGVSDDLAGGVTVHGVLHHAMRIEFGEVMSVRGLRPFPAGVHHAV